MGKKSSFSITPQFLSAALACLLIIIFAVLAWQPNNQEVKGVEKPTLRLALPSPQPLPLHIGLPAPNITAESVIIIDVNSAAVLYEKNPDQRRYPASTTKIMTALVALDEYQLDEVVTIQDAYQSIGHKAEIFPGEQLTVLDLLYALMLSSGNDAAVALAQHHPGGYGQFIEHMNQKAKLLNLDNSHFMNVSGIEDPLHYMSARDLAILTKDAIKHQVLAQIVATPQITITSVDGKYTHTFENLNQLLTTVPGVKGVKTGWTQIAGECLVTLTEREGRQVIVVVMGSQDRLAESELLIEWAFANHTWLQFSEFLKEIEE